MIRLKVHPCVLFWRLNRVRFWSNSSINFRVSPQQLGLCFVVCWWFGAFAASTQLHTKSQLGRQPCRAVINNCPFVPFLPRLFLFPAPLSRLAQSLPSTNCLHFSSTPQFSNMLPFFYLNIFIFVSQKTFCSLICAPVFPHTLLRSGQSKELLSYFSWNGSISRRPTASDMRVCMSVHSQIITATAVYVSKVPFWWKGLHFAHRVESLHGNELEKQQINVST